MANFPNASVSTHQQQELYCVIPRVIPGLTTSTNDTQVIKSEGFCVGLFCSEWNTIGFKTMLIILRYVLLKKTRTDKFFTIIYFEQRNYPLDIWPACLVLNSLYRAESAISIMYESQIRGNLVYFRILGNCRGVGTRSTCPQDFVINKEVSFYIQELPLLLNKKCP